MSKIRLLILALIAFLPSFLKRPCYRLFFGYKIGKGVKIGLTLLDAKNCAIDDNVTIGHLNVFIPNPIAVNEVDSRFLLGDGSVIAASHKIDFTDRVEFGKCVILGGRNSSLWTHNRQMTKPIIIGDYSYIGSEIRMVPGSEIPAKCIVGIGSVITKKLEGEYNLIGGMPAKIIRELDEDGRFLTAYKTRPDLPDEI
jgi:acetyltransferase-like isoleucine patch superfamily enzyme